MGFGEDDELSGMDSRGVRELISFVSLTRSRVI